MFEAIVCAQWILAADSERRARYYHVHNLRRKRLWAMRTLAGTSEGVTFIAEMSKFGIQIPDDAKSRAGEQLKEIDQKLALLELAPIDADFDTILRTRKMKRNVAWYVPLGIKSIAAMAKAAGNAALYLILYSGASEVMHSSSDDRHFWVKDGKVRIKPIRYLADFDVTFWFSTALVISMYMAILDRYRPGARAAFSRKYVENWRDQFMRSVKINYTDTKLITI